MNAAPDTERRRKGFEPLDQGHRLERDAVERRGSALLEAQGVALTGTWARERLTREHPGTLRYAAARGQRLLAADGDAPETAVDRVGRAAGRQRQSALLQVRLLGAAHKGMIAHRREHLQLRGQGAQCDFEAHLVIAGRGAAVRDHAAAELVRHARHGLCLHDAFGADTERIELAAAHVAHDQKAQHLLEIIGARVDLMMRARTERQGTLTQCAGAARIDAAGVYRHGNDRTVIILDEPRHQERGVQAARVGQHDRLVVCVSGLHMDSQLRNSELRRSISRC